MKPLSLRLLSLFSIGLAFMLGPSRADDSSSPPAPPPVTPSPNASPAEGNPPPRHRHMPPAYVLAVLTEKLDLTADQQKTVRNIIANARTKGKDLRDDDSISRPEKRIKMRQLFIASHDQIRAVLTADQQKLFDALPINSGMSAAQPAPGTN